MWQPEPGWERLPTGPSSVGAWAADIGGHRVVVKRFERPGPHDATVLDDPGHPAYWRRDVDVAASGAVEHTPGLRGLPAVEVEEDADGATVVTPWVDEVAHDGLCLARGLGRFATATVPRVDWLARSQFALRVGEVERRGGWATLARTPVADLADAVWRRRGQVVARLTELPWVLQHGDPVPANLRGRQDDTILAIDWSSLGVGPAGADLGYLALSVPEDLEDLLSAYLDGLGHRDDAVPGAGRGDVAFAARAVVTYTVLTRADWALARVAGGEGALAGKFRHPSVAPYIRAMQRHLPHVVAVAQGG
ncbi:phosphotransferase [Nocardioides sp. Y6]|uniref:Phosphotransferase n=1 Tax=Nocardioides malaquae TaxID=2773426 RepID=A0ABR9RSN5_9ACTN|nr:phosphotransferase [Nocardioides malaquae]MBE7324395.1 phosphotransferase [Nocardioides malaquae]